MGLYAISDGKLIEQKPSSFEELSIRERADLQRLLRNQPDALGEDLKIIAEEFGSWDDSRRRIDLLGRSSPWPGGVLGCDLGVCGLAVGCAAYM